MKKFYIALFMLVFSGILVAQPWVQDLPQDKLQNGELKLQEIQKAFNDYWDPYNVEGGYFIDENGEKVKASGWKQFKRWEWKAEYLVDGLGSFSKTSTVEEMEKYNQIYPDAGKSLTGNWTNIGYNSSNGGYQGIGRVNCIAFHPTNSNTFWVGTPSGGLWRTTNDGASWTVLTDNNTVLGVSAIAVTSNYATSNTIYIGTGDRDGGSGWSMGGGNTHDNEGIGVLKSANGGATWTSSLSFTPSQKVVIYDLLIDPNNNNKLLAATTNGVYYTTNGGTTWANISSIACTDLKYQPGNSNVVYGAYYQWVMKYSWTGSSWTWVYPAPSLPSSSSTRTEIAVSANNPNIVYAITVNTNNNPGPGLEAIYKSTNSGVSYTSIFNGSTSGNNLLGYPCNGTTTTGQGWYDVFITANPSNANDVYVGGINVWRLNFSGSPPYTGSIKSHWNTTCFSPPNAVSIVHADQHCCEFRPGTSDIYLGNDGGIYKSTNNGTTWNDLSNGLTISQIYRLGVSTQTSNEVINGLQDNGTHLYSGGSWVMDGVMGGDGMECLIDPTDNNVQFGEFPSGEIHRTSDHWSSKSNVRNMIRAATGATGSEKGAWVTPFMLDPNNRLILFVGYDELWKSTDQGATSTNFSKLTVSSFSGPSDIKSIQIAPSNSNYIYVSYDSYYINPTTYPSSLHKSSDGGSTWTNITSGLPVSSGDITYIAIKNNDPNTVWVTIGGFNTNAVYQTINGGTSWTNISTGLPSIPAMSIVQNVRNTNMVELYVAMSQGVYVKYGTTNWTLYKSGLPNVFCTELEIYYDNTTPSNSRLRVATYGRGLWESSLPVVDFAANNTLPLNSMTTVGFMDISTNSPTGWSWSFNPSTVTYVAGTNSVSQNPQVQFMNLGAYTVTLLTTNALGSDSETKTSYIHMGNPGLWTGATSISWNTTANWDNHMIPISSIGVSIDPTAINWPTKTGNLVVGTDCQSLNMGSGYTQLTVTGDLTIPNGTSYYVDPGGNPDIIVGENWTNHGTFTPGNSVVKMNGTSNSSLIANTVNNGNQTTTYAAGFLPWPGCYFDIMASGVNNISINSFDIHCSATGPVNIEVWYTNFSYMGNTGNPGVWTQLGTTQTVIGQGLNNPTPVNPGASLNILAGQSYGFYINCYSGTNGYLYFSANNNFYFNAEITINTGEVYWGIPVGSGSTSTGYTFNGTVYYSYALQYSMPFWDLEISKTNASITTNGDLNINNNFTVKPDAWFTNAPGNTINVHGNTIFEADANGTASFIDNGFSNFINFQPSVESYIAQDMWHLVSAPINNAQSIIFTGIYLLEFDEPTYTWNSITQTNYNLTAGKGFMAWSSSGSTGNATVNYNGPLNIGNISVGGLSYTSTQPVNDRGWNMVGNPYPSAINWNGNWARTNLDATAYIYNNGNYVTWNGFAGTHPNGDIASGQGFFLKANATGAALTIPQSERKHSTQIFYKNGGQLNELFLTVEGNGYIDKMIVQFNDDATVQFDGGFDAWKLKGDVAAPQLYSVYANNELTVNALPFEGENMIIPINFEAGTNGLFTISVDGLENFGVSSEIWFEDKKEDKMIDLIQVSSYGFYSNIDDVKDRFLLHFGNPIGIGNESLSSISIYSYGDMVYVQKPAGFEGQIGIYDILGQEIISRKATGEGLESMKVSTGTAYYLVKVQSGDKLFTEKVLIK